SQGFGAISNQLASAQHEFEASQQEVSRLLDNLQITDMDESSTRNAMQMENQSLLQYQAQYDSLYIEQSRTLKQLSQISEIDDKTELKVVVPTVFQEDSLTLNFPALFQREADASSRLAAMSEELGPENSSLKASRAELDDITQRLEEKIAGLIRGVQIKAQANSNRLATLKEEIEKKEADYRAKWTDI